MRTFKFDFIVTKPDTTFEAMSYDMADIFMALEENPFIRSCDMFNFGDGTGVSMLILTDILTIPEIEAILLEKFSEAPRSVNDYILMSPDSED